jgi:hypothetical protein
MTLLTDRDRTSAHIRCLQSAETWTDVVQPQGYPVLHEQPVRHLIATRTEAL